MNVSDEGRAPEQFQGPYISANAFTLIGQKPLLGRDFLPEDDRPGAAAVVMLGNGIWKNRYGSDPSVIGRTIKVNERAGDRDRRHAGRLEVPANADLWHAARADAAPRRAEARRAQPRGLRRGWRHGVTMAQAQSELSTIAARLAHDYPDTNKDITADA